MAYNQYVKQIMRRAKVLDVSIYDSVTKAIEQLDLANVSALPVRDAVGTYIGVISKTDIASKRFLELLNKRGRADNIMVEEMMNLTPPLVVQEFSPVQDAINLMHQRHIRRVFVVNSSNELIGVVSTTDIMRLLSVEKDKVELCDKCRAPLDKEKKPKPAEYKKPKLTWE